MWRCSSTAYRACGCPVWWPRFQSNCGRGLWRSASHPSTLEPMFLLWLTWPHKWQCHLTDFECVGLLKNQWGWPAPWQWPPSVSLCGDHDECPISKIYTLYMHLSFWCRGYGPQLRIKRSQIWVSATVVWCCVTGQGTSPVCVLLWPRNEWVPLPGTTILACVFE